MKDLSGSTRPKPRLTIDHTEKVVCCDNAPIDLSDQDWEVLALFIAAGPKGIVSKQALCKQLQLPDGNWSELNAKLGSLSAKFGTYRVPMKMRWWRMTQLFLGHTEPEENAYSVKSHIRSHGSAGYSLRNVTIV